MPYLTESALAGLHASLLTAERERDALAARVAQAEGMAEALEKAAAQFDFYAEQHRGKQTFEGAAKMQVNRDMAATMRTALAAWRAAKEVGDG